jgi:hypothetical protein
MARNIHGANTETSRLLPSSEYSFSSRTRLSARWKYVIALVLVALISAFSFSKLTSPPGLKEYPPDGPGVGISLSTDYNTIAIRFDNGTIQTVSELPTTEEYNELLKRLSQASSQHPYPPYWSIDDEINDRPRQWRRNIRKKFGYPASSDVRILADVINQLVVAAQKFLPSSQLPLTSAIVVVPNAIALYPEDINDALEFIGLQSLTGHNVYTTLRALPAAYAGHRLGLCAHPNDFERCLSEEQNIPRLGVVVVDLNKASLGVDSQYMDTPMYVFIEHVAKLNWRVGHIRGGINEEYWQLIRNDLQYVVDRLVASSGKPQGEKFVDEVLIVGEMGANETLKVLVREVVAGVQKEEATIRNDNPKSVVAEGAAELAKRLLVQRGGYR